MGPGAERGRPESDGAGLVSGPAVACGGVEV